MSTTFERRAAGAYPLGLSGEHELGGREAVLQARHDLHLLLEGLAHVQVRLQHPRRVVLSDMRNTVRI